MNYLAILVVGILVLIAGCITSFNEGAAGLVEGSLSGTSAKLGNCTAGDSVEIQFVKPAGGSRTRMYEETVYPAGWQNDICIVRDLQGRECAYTKAEFQNMSSQPIEMMDLVAERCGFK